MEALEFACFMERLQKLLDTDMDSNLVDNIYDIYSHTYDNYGLFELYSFIRKNGKKITADMMNWGTLIKIAKSLGIPQKHMKDPIIEPMWYLMRNKDDNTMSITLTYPKFEIVKGDVISIDDGFTYEINEIYLLDESLYASDDEDAICDDCMVCLENLDTGDFEDVRASGFICKLNCEYIQYVNSNWLSYVNR
jgi:hypothetical protein